MEKKEKKSLLGRTKHKWVALGLAGTIAASAFIPAVSQAWTPRSVIEIHNSIVAQNQHYGETLHGYRVQYGDTVWGLSKATGESVGSIARTYGISNPSRIYAGQVLRRVGDIQDSVSNEDVYYTVQWGDTLYNISRAFGTTVDQLVEWNNIANRNLIYVGDRLQVRPIGEQVNTPVEKPAPEVPVEEVPTPEVPVEEAPTPELPVEEVPTPEVPVEDDPTLGPVPEVPQQPETPEEPEAPEEEPEEVPVVPEEEPEVPVVPEEPAPEDEDENYDPPITVKQRISYEPIPYEVERVENPELDEGEERVVQEGVAGERKYVWEQTIKGDILTNESLEYSEVVKEPITKIIEFGAIKEDTTRIEESSWFTVTPYQTVRKDNPDLPLGEERIVQEGIDEKVEVHYRFTYLNDEIVESELLREEVIIEGQPQIIEVGTAIELPEGYVQLIDDDFDESHYYIRDDKFVVLPEYNPEINMDPTYLFVGSDIKGVISSDTILYSTTDMFSQVQTDSLDLTELDVSMASNMSGMFYGSRIGSLDIRGFDTSEAGIMNFMFYNSNIDELRHDDLDTSNTTSMAYMFGFSKVLHQGLLDVLDTQNVYNMEVMFMNTNVDGIDFSFLDTSSVENMSRMFAQTEGDTLDISTVTIPENADITDMFYLSDIQTVYVKDEATAERLRTSHEEDIRLRLESGHAYSKDPVNFVVK